MSRNPDVENLFGSPIAKSIFDAAVEGLLVVAADGTVLAMNASFSSLYGIDRSETVGQHYTFFANDLEVRRLDERVDEKSWVTLRALQGERVLGVLQTVRNKMSGREFVARCGATPIFEDGVFFATTITVEDATEATHASQRIEAALSAAEVGVWWVDLAKGRLWGDKNFARIYGLTAEETTGGELSRAYELMHLDDRERATEALRRAAHSGIAHEIEFRVVAPDGGCRWLLSRGKSQLDEQGNPITRMGSVVDITRQKAAEEAQRQSGETFQSLVENSPLGVYAIDADFRLILVSQGAQKVFENVRPLLGRDFSEVMRTVWEEPFATEAIGRFRHTLETGIPFHAPSTVERRGDLGELESYDWKIERIAMPDGRPGVVCNFYNLSERQRLEAALKESEAQYRQISEGLPQLVWSAAADGVRDYFNGRWYEYTGISLDESENPWLTVLHPDDREAAQRKWQSSVETGVTFQAEYRLHGRNDRYRWFLGRAVAIRNVEGQVVRWFGTCTDIHEQKITEGILALTNELGTTLIEDLDAERIVQALTDSSTKAIGAEFGSFFYAQPEETLGPDGSERFGLYVLSGAPRESFEGFPPVRTTPLFAPTFHGEGTVRSDDIALDPRFSGMPEGHLPVRSYLAVSVRGRDGGILGGLLFGHAQPGMFTQEHERLVDAFAAQASVAYENAVLYKRLNEAKKELESRVAERTQELVRANRDLNEFAYSVAHDLRAPLRAIVSTSQILLEDATDRLTENEQEALKRQATNALRLATIVDDLLAFARLANSELKKTDFDMTSLVEATAAEVGRRWNYRCQVVVGPQMEANGDPTLLGYVLTNLLDNAFKYSPHGGTIRIGEQDGAFFVRDEGVGFDMTHAGKLFIAFERLVDQETFEGTGVGLANVKRIVERHGGRVWAESEPGKGSTFWFTLE